jgi:hypothetical protein
MTRETLLGLAGCVRAMPQAARAFAASPSGHSSVSVPSRASIAIARKRNWRGQFVKSLRQTPDGSREWLIWSRYHAAWHCRSSEGGACGYTSDIANAGLFERAKADAYNDGDRNEAFHVSEKLHLIHAALRRHNEAVEALLTLDRAASGTLTEGGDVEQAPGESLSGPTAEGPSL